MDKITLTVNEVAGLLGVSYSTIYKMTQNEQIPYAKIRGKIIFHKGTIEKWLINGANKGGNEKS